MANKTVIRSPKALDAYFGALDVPKANYAEALADFKALRRFYRNQTPRRAFRIRVDKPYVISSPAYSLSPTRVELCLKSARDDQQKMSEFVSDFISGLRGNIYVAAGLLKPPDRGFQTESHFIEFCPLRDLHGPLSPSFLIAIDAINAVQTAFRSYYGPLPRLQAIVAKKLAGARQSFYATGDTCDLVQLMEPEGLEQFSEELIGAARRDLFSIAAAVQNHPEAKRIVNKLGKAEDNREVTSLFLELFRKIKGNGYPDEVQRALLPIAEMLLFKNAIRAEPAMVLPIAEWQPRVIAARKERERRAGRRAVLLQAATNHL